MSACPPPQSALERGGFLRPDALNNSNKLELFVFANDKQGQARAALPFGQLPAPRCADWCEMGRKLCSMLFPFFFSGPIPYSLLFPYSFRCVH